MQVSRRVTLGAARDFSAWVAVGLAACWSEFQLRSGEPGRFVAGDAHNQRCWSRPH